MKIIRYYLMIYLADMLLIYGILMVYIVRMCNLDVDTYYYATLSIIGLFISMSFSLKIRENGKLKSLYFSIFELICVLVMCLYYLNKYEVNILTIESLSLGNILLYVMLVSLIYRDYNFYVSSLEELEKTYKKWLF
ncbi:hypothetical protein [Sulfurovum mangrovi]|uniref:hypothetical protein n=1 Tax=Sulfurovum mangrovi TaxID=2893889 RepID=UPI001E489B5E|nr:hypothetical protein [Sulfurovum mangrovi]UFH59973.1 hypothetical protein LN246_03780 [Sulfurovum mangrovi]